MTHLCSKNSKNIIYGHIFLMLFKPVLAVVTASSQRVSNGHLDENWYEEMLHPVITFQ